MEKIFRKSMLYKTGVEYGDYCMNHVVGCAHGCKYPCYAFLMKKHFGEVKDYADWCHPKIVANTLELLDKEIPRLKDKIKSVHLCFSTDPFPFDGEDRKRICMMSGNAIGKLNDAGIKCTVLTKGLLPTFFILPGYSEQNEYGISLVSLDEEFRKQYEPFTAPYVKRIERLEHLHKNGCKTWVSIEPYPTPNIFDQDLEEILQAVSFVDKIVFGKWNYGKAAGYPKWKNFYNACANEVIDFCELHDIECFIKKGTVSEINLFDRNGCQLKLGDSVRILANEHNIFYDLTPDDDTWLEWDSYENTTVCFNSNTNCFELCADFCLEYAYWNLNHDFPDGMKIPFLEVFKEVNYA